MNHLAAAAQVLGLALGFPAGSFALGWAAMRKLPGLDAEERFTASWGAAFAIMAASQFLAFASGATHQGIVDLSVAGALAIACALLGRRVPVSHAGNTVSCWPLVAIWALGYAHLLCIQSMLPNYLGSEWYYDWWMHYDITQIFLRQPNHPIDTVWFTGANLGSRTPLFNLTAAFLMNGAGPQFPNFQLANALLNSCFVPALYLVVRDLFDRRAARLAALLAGLNLWILHFAWFTWSKTLAVYFGLLGLHFYLRFVRQRADEPDAARASFLSFWTSMLLGFLTHSVIFFYLVGLAAHAAFVSLRDRRLLPRMRDLAALGAIGLAIVGPWYAWLWHAFGAEKMQVTPRTTFTPDVDRADILSMMVYNVAVSFYPESLFERWPALGQSASASWASLYQGLTGLYFSMLPGAITISLCLFFLVRAGLAIRRRPERTGPSDPATTAATCFVLLGALGAVALHPVRSPWGVAHSAFFPSVFALVGLAWGAASRAPRPWVAVAASGAVLEFLAMFWSHRWYVIHDPRVLEPPLANPSYKYDTRITFLWDDLGPAVVGFLAAAILVQAALCWKLVRELYPRRARGTE